MKSYNKSSSPFKYTTVFSQNSLASVKVGEENNISLASLDPLQPLIPDAVDLGRNIDLLGVAFNAAVANKFNNNGDGIETNTALAIKDYFIHKPTNIEHDRSRVVGHIVNAGISAYGQENSELIPEEELKGTYSPFHISLAAVVYRIVNSDFANLINDSSDPDHENYQMVSASWELGFNEYVIALGSDDLTEAELISDETQVKELSQYLITQGGAGEMKDGTKVNRLVIGDVYPLGIGFTATPAADVKGVVTKTEKKDLKSYSNVEKIEINKNFLTPLLIKENKKISQNDKKWVNLSDNKNIIMESQEIIQEFKAALDQHKFDKEAVASMTDTFTSAIKQKDEQYQAELEQAQNAEKELVKQQEELQASVKDLAAQLKEATDKVQNLEDAQAQEVVKASFNERMGALDSAFDLEDEDKTIIAQELNQLDVSEEAFAEYKSRFDQVWKHKNKAHKEEQEKAFQEKLQAALEAKLNEMESGQTSVASEVTSEEVTKETAEEVVEGALEQAEAANTEISNSNESLSEEAETWAEKFKGAFKDSVSVQY